MTECSESQSLEQSDVAEEEGTWPEEHCAKDWGDCCRGLKSGTGYMGARNINNCSHCVLQGFYTFAIYI